MHNDLETLLTEVAEDTLAAMAFLLPSDEAAADAEPSDAEVAVEIAFSGPFCGGMRLTVAESMLPLLAANILGSEDGAASQEEQLDALKETLNVICGNLLPRIASPQEVFHVASPQMATDDAAARADAAEPEASACVWTEGGAVRLTLFVERPLTATAQ